MPLYDFRCECGHTWEASYTIAQRDAPLSEPCPSCQRTGHVERYLPTGGHGGFCYTMERGVKAPDAFKDVLRNIKKNHRGSTINV